MREIAFGNLHFPLIVKPRKGSASMGIATVHSNKELLAASRSNSDCIIQEFIEGPEWGVDAYVDLINRKTITVFTKKKLKMRAGETDKAVSKKSTALMGLCKRLVEELSLVGPVDIDCFETGKGFVISEINPRFGGGYPLAYACGVDFTKMILNNLNARENSPMMGKFVENKFMFKYSSICVKQEKELL
jgi:carbamoyl-phosphate synthase large subunit